MNLYLCLEARPIKHSFISCRLAPLPLSVIHLVLQLTFIINSLLVLIYFYTRPISSFIFSALICPSLCLHHCVSFCIRCLCSVQALVRAVGSADLCCWLKPCSGCACVYVCLPTCIYVYSWRTSCCAVTCMLIFAVTAVHLELLFICC